MPAVYDRFLLYLSEIFIMLYIVPTPIGNLEDITFRALRILKEVDTILAEDTRQSKILLNHYQIQTTLYSYHMHNEHRIVKHWAEKIAEGANIALISDAGTPAISDPGFLLVREALALGVKVECLPGATAFVPALVQSGFPSERFLFEGFLPLKKGRQTRILSFAKESRTVVMYESPHRIIKLVEEIVQLLGANRELALCREISKKFQETLIMPADGLLMHLKNYPPKGEIVLVLKGV
jgi:16S rRNA (cytidine1402-2'-O)-methyltransferase